MSDEKQDDAQFHMESELETMETSGGNAQGSLQQSLMEGPQHHQGHLLAARMRLAGRQLQGVHRQDTLESRGGKPRSYSVPSLPPLLQGPGGQANVASFLKHIGDEYNESRSPTRKEADGGASSSRRRSSYEIHPGSAPTSEPRSLVSTIMNLVRKMSGAGISDNCEETDAVQNDESRWGDKTD